MPVKSNLKSKLCLHARVHLYGPYQHARRHAARVRVRAAHVITDASLRGAWCGSRSRLLPRVVNCAPCLYLFVPRPSPSDVSIDASEHELRRWMRVHLEFLICALPRRAEPELFLKSIRIKKTQLHANRTQIYC